MSQAVSTPRTWYKVFAIMFAAATVLAVFLGLTILLIPKSPNCGSNPDCVSGHIQWGGTLLLFAGLSWIPSLVFWSHYRLAQIPKQRSVPLVNLQPPMLPDATNFLQYVRRSRQILRVVIIVYAVGLLLRQIVERSTYQSTVQPLFITVLIVATVGFVSVLIMYIVERVRLKRFRNTKLQSSIFTWVKTQYGITLNREQLTIFTTPIRTIDGTPYHSKSIALTRWDGSGIPTTAQVSLVRTVANRVELYDRTNKRILPTLRARPVTPQRTQTATQPAPARVKTQHYAFEPKFWAEVAQNDGNVYLYVEKLTRDLYTIPTARGEAIAVWSSQVRAEKWKATNNYEIFPVPVDTFKKVTLSYAADEHYRILFNGNANTTYQPQDVRKQLR